MQSSSVIAFFEDTDKIRASINLGEMHTSPTILNLFEEIKDHVSDQESPLKAPDELIIQCGNPILIKIAGHTGSGNFDSYWAIYLNGCCLIIFEDPSTLSEWNRVYEWVDNSAFSLVCENAAISPIKKSDEFNNLQDEFIKYASWEEDDILYSSDNFDEMKSTADIDEDLGLYIVDPDSVYDYDVIAEISGVWPLSFKL